MLYNSNIDASLPLAVDTRLATLRTRCGPFLCPSGVDSDTRWMRKQMNLVSTTERAGAYTGEVYRHGEESVSPWQRSKGRPGMAVSRRYR